MLHLTASYRPPPERRIDAILTAGLDPCEPRQALALNAPATLAREPPPPQSWQAHELKVRCGWEFGAARPIWSLSCMPRWSTTPSADPRPVTFWQCRKSSPWPAPSTARCGAPIHPSIHRESLTASPAAFGQRSCAAGGPFRSRCLGSCTRRSRHSPTLCTTPSQSGSLRRLRAQYSAARPRLLP